MKICIIGAGASGICTARHCISKSNEIIIYEKMEQIGGTWILENAFKQRHSSSYEGLM